MGDDIYADWVGEKAIFGMACFWSIEAQFGVSLGVVRTRVGYAGGSTLSPTYRNLGDHTEVVEVEFDPKVTTYANILDIFWNNHNPTAKASRQYMSAIFYHNEDQKQRAKVTLAIEQGKRAQTIQTEILPVGLFTPAEDYHQKYKVQSFPFILAELDMDPGEELNHSFVATRLNGYVGGFGTVDQFDEEVDKLDLTPKLANYVRKMVADGTGAGGTCGLHK